LSTEGNRKHTTGIEMTTPPDLLHIAASILRKIDADSLDPPDARGSAGG
jgi:hypothetical protein